jgi:hypothetical protein
MTDFTTRSTDGCREVDIVFLECQGECSLQLREEFAYCLRKAVEEFDPMEARGRFSMLHGCLVRQWATHHGYAFVPRRTEYYPANRENAAMFEPWPSTSDAFAVRAIARITYRDQGPRLFLHTQVESVLNPDGAGWARFDRVVEDAAAQMVASEGQFDHISIMSGDDDGVGRMLTFQRIGDGLAFGVTDVDANFNLMAGAEARPPARPPTRSTDTSEAERSTAARESEDKENETPDH